ncbi:unnamed protein product [marine sediment metagenome]|uniref:Uncharacterized protein n=1 Tax=marine sediment metagenome TaxID=412755 RepID=X1NGX8_9ZZZZ
MVLMDLIRFAQHEKRLRALEKSQHRVEMRLRRQEKADETNGLMELIRREIRLDELRTRADE